MRYIFLSGLLLFALSSHAQEDIKAYVSLQGSFNYNQQGILTLPNQVPAIQKTNTYNINPKFLKRISEHLYLGVGFNYDYNKVETENPNVLNSGQRSVVIERGISPTLNAEWIKPLNEKLTFSISGNIYYSFLTKDKDSYYVDLNTGDIIDYNSHWDAEMIGLQLNPNLRYLLFNKLGIQLSFANIEWNKKINDSRFEELDLNESNIRIGLNIEDWQFGVYYNIH